MLLTLRVIHSLSTRTMTNYMLNLVISYESGLSLMSVMGNKWGITFLKKKQIQQILDLCYLQHTRRI